MEENRKTIHRAGDSSEELSEEISALFNSFFGEVLSMLSLTFPHDKGDGSENEKLYNCLRSKILRCGNNKIRVLPEMLSKYIIEEIFEDKKTIKVIRERVKIRKGE